MLTASILIGAFSLFLNSILAAFGLVATSIEQMNQLRQSQQVVETMKDRNADKKHKSPRKFAQKAGKKLSTTAVAAATVGTVAVVGVTTFFLAEEYCDEKEELNEETNLLYGTNEAFNRKACLTAAEQDVKVVWDDVKEGATGAVKTAIDETSEYSSEKWAAVKEATAAALRKANESTGETWTDMKSWFGD